MIITAYFHTDEAEQLCGPYVSAEDAEMASTLYGKYLTGDIQTMNEEEMKGWREKYRQAILRAQDLRDQIIRTLL